jgi:co-chaperonin GroES (HSP10)
MIYPTRIEPHHDLVVVRRVDQTKTKGGIILPYHHDRKESHIAKIVEVGPGVEGRPETKPKCKVGEFWLIARFIGTVVPLNGADHTIVKWNDCQCKLHFDDETIKLLDDAFVDSRDKEQAA